MSWKVAIIYAPLPLGKQLVGQLFSVVIIIKYCGEARSGSNWRVKAGGTVLHSSLFGWLPLTQLTPNSSSTGLHAILCSVSHSCNGALPPSWLSWPCLASLLSLAFLATPRDGLSGHSVPWVVPEMGSLLHWMLAQAILVCAEWSCLLGIPGLSVCLCAGSYASHPPLSCQPFLPPLLVPLLAETEIISISKDVQILVLTFKQIPGLKNSLK